MSVDWHPIYTGLRNKLLLNTTLTGIAPQTQWFADQLPDRSVTYPALRYTIITESPDQRLSAGDNINVDLQIDGYAERQGPVVLKSLMDQVLVSLDRQSLAVTGYSDVACMCISRPTPFKEHPYFRLRSIFRLFGTAL